MGEVETIPVHVQSALVAIVGPTAVGKSEIAIELAEALDGEIISADSRQVYRHMDIGTAKPTLQERQRVPHHLLDILDPDEVLTLADFQGRAYAAIDRVLAAGKLPLLVGGTGQYVRAVLEGWSIPRVPPQPSLRADLEAMAEVYGATVLYAWLTAVDPAAARTIDWRNVRRIVRALEVYLVSDQPISALQTRQPPAYRVLRIGLTRSRPSLYARIDERVDRMIDSGLLDEIEALLGAGWGWHLPSMSSLGYVQFRGFFRGETTVEDAVRAVKRETRRFVRQQYTWFRLDDPTLVWYDLDTVCVGDILSHVRSWLRDA